ncbi:alpha/beta hydrolase [Variovorax sp. J22G73]|uniref:alpha/beta fold hydrolase n=1 Tax=unclassified Variovorax TaxID=663243 RepID=UPI002577C2EC|nr:MULTISPECIES: alpha/beta hydrolase [unclassified Variovorax]MDM0005441.1 alpha/beta hydrolase [Variovorax sp. J22R203]MDM0098857.1 alpha/beta hydrolase [Variovorax sp. J22G73]
MKILANSVHLEVSQQGAGDMALVFLHYWGGSSRTWAPVVSRLSDTFRCVALDGRGQGSSEAPTEGYSAVDLADDVLAAVEQLGIGDYILVGHSMGGKTAQVAASRRPIGLRGIAMVASSPPSPMQIDDVQRAQMTKAYANREAVEWTLDNVLTGSPLSREAREQAIEDALRLSPQASLGWIDTGTREDFSHRVAAIDVPVVIVAGELDRVDPVAVVRDHIAVRYPQAAVHLIPNRGHLLPVEAPREVADILRTFARAARAVSPR